MADKTNPVNPRERMVWETFAAAALSRMAGQWHKRGYPERTMPDCCAAEAAMHADAMLKEWRKRCG